MSALYAIGFVLAAIFVIALIVDTVTKAIAKPSLGQKGKSQHEL